MLTKIEWSYVGVCANGLTQESLGTPDQAS